VLAVLFSPRANLYWKETTPSKVEQALSNHMEDSAAMLPQDAKKKSIVSA
jgi:hypothetical protein